MTVPEAGAVPQQITVPDLLRELVYLELAGKTKSVSVISSVTSDSREVLPGSLFVAVRGYCTDGHRFISSAEASGAAAVICEEFPSDTTASCVYIKVSDSRQALAVAARLFYGNAAEGLKIIGVTGTNGKTTTAKLITAMLNDNGISAGYIGTNLCSFAGREIPLDRTTPEAHGLHALFSMMLEAGCKAAVMEVSSHALVLQRVYGIRFHAALFTNLTMEHLDFHESMQEYASAKQLLFDQLGPDGFAVFNTDDPYARQMSERVAPEKIYCCTMQDGHSPASACRSRFEAEILQSTIASSTVSLHFPDQLITMQVGLPGIFNVMNVLEAAATGFGMGIAPQDICRSLSAVSAIDGRMERIGGLGTGFSVFVDYAHTPDALFKALDALRTLKPEGSRLLVVFGCGGNRDKAKRPEMGRIASETADEVIITSDNPRDEDPEDILDEIERGIITGAHYTRISDRSDAVRAAVSMLHHGDLLLVAGKGHEKYQEIAGRKEFFSDQDLLKKYMQENCSGYPAKELK